MADNITISVTGQIATGNDFDTQYLKHHRGQSSSTQDINLTGEFVLPDNLRPTIVSNPLATEPPPTGNTENLNSFVVFEGRRFYVDMQGNAIEFDSVAFPTDLVPVPVTAEPMTAGNTENLDSFVIFQGRVFFIDAEGESIEINNAPAVAANTAAITTLQVGVQDNANSLTTLEGVVAGNANAISGLTDNINNLTFQINIVSNNAAQNTNAIADNANAVSVLTDNINNTFNQLGNDISSNTTTINDNADSITANIAAIGANANAISGLTDNLNSLVSQINGVANAVAQNQTDIDNNVSDITDNAIGITTNQTGIDINTQAIAAITTLHKDNYEMTETRVLQGGNNSMFWTEFANINLKGTVVALNTNDGPEISSIGVDPVQAVIKKEKTDLSQGTAIYFENNKVRLVTPDSFSGSIPDHGYVLTNVNKNTGEVEFQPNPAVANAQQIALNISAINDNATLITAKETLYEGSGELAIPNTVVNGGATGKSIFFTNLGRFVASGNTQIGFNVSNGGGSADVSIYPNAFALGVFENGSVKSDFRLSNSGLQLRTPRLITQDPLDPVNAGDVLTLVDTNGDCEFKPASGFYTADGQLTAHRTVDGGGKTMSFLDLASTNIETRIIAIRADAGLLNNLLRCDNSGFFLSSMSTNNPSIKNEILIRPTSMKVVTSNVLNNLVTPGMVLTAIDTAGTIEYQNPLPAPGPADYFLGGGSVREVTATDHAGIISAQQSGDSINIDADNLPNGFWIDLMNGGGIGGFPEFNVPITFQNFDFVTLRDNSSSTDIAGGYTMLAGQPLKFRIIKSTNLTYGELFIYGR